MTVETTLKKLKLSGFHLTSSLRLASRYFKQLHFTHATYFQSFINIISCSNILYNNIEREKPSYSSKRCLKMTPFVPIDWTQPLIQQQC